MQHKQYLPLIMAAACAFAVANLYYNQPLLELIAHSFGVDESKVGAIPTLTQAGYAIGLGFLVPLGDIRERRRLILIMLGLVTVALIAAACAPNIPFLAVASLAIGVTTVVPQMLIPFAVHLASPEARGKTVGTLMSGLLLGILLSRTVAGFVGSALGWRAVYFMGAALMVLLAIVLRVLLPKSHPEARDLTYAALLRSVLRLAKEQPVLREAAVIGALIFGSFSVFWATLVFHLATPAFHLGEQASRITGVFGLVGAVGALAAPVVGRLADRRSPRFLVGAGVIITFASFLLFLATGMTMWGLIAGVVLMDLGVQTQQVANQTRVYSLIPGATSRLNTVYMVTYFIGGATGSLLGSLGWGLARWIGVCVAGIALTGTALTVHGLSVAAARSLARRGE